MPEVVVYAIEGRSTDQKRGTGTTDQGRIAGARRKSCRPVTGSAEQGGTSRTGLHHGIAGTPGEEQ